MILQRKISQFCVMVLFLLSLSNLQAMKRLDDGENGDRPEKNEKTSNLDNKITEKQNEEENKMSCVICLEVLEENETFPWPFCGHKFHDECANEWKKISQTCPICRTHNGEEPRGIDLSELEQLLEIDPESTYVIETTEVRERILELVRSIINANRARGVNDAFTLTIQFNQLSNTFNPNGSRYTSNAVHSPASNYNEPESNLCATQINETDRQNSKKTDREKPRDHSILNHSNYINELPMNPRYRAFQHGNNCFWCFKNLPFNERTLGRDELCDECQKSYGMIGKKNKENEVTDIQESKVTNFQENEVADFQGNYSDNKNDSNKQNDSNNITMESLLENKTSNILSEGLFGNGSNCNSSKYQRSFGNHDAKMELKRHLFERNAIKNRKRSLFDETPTNLKNDGENDRNELDSRFRSSQNTGGLFGNSSPFGSNDNQRGFSIGRERNTLTNLNVSEQLEQQSGNCLNNNDGAVGFFGDETLQNHCLFAIEPSNNQNKEEQLPEAEKSDKENEESSHQNPNKPNDDKILQ